MNSEIGEYFGINGSAVSGAITRIEEMQGQAETQIRQPQRPQSQNSLCSQKLKKLNPEKTFTKKKRTLRKASFYFCF